MVAGTLSCEPTLGSALLGKRVRGHRPGRLLLRIAVQGPHMCPRCGVPLPGRRELAHHWLPLRSLIVYCVSEFGTVAQWRASLESAY